MFLGNFICVPHEKLDRMIEEEKKRKDFLNQMQEVFKDLKFEIFPRSSCCNALLTQTKGGVIMNICSSCKKVDMGRIYR